MGIFDFFRKKESKSGGSREPINNADIKEEYKELLDELEEIDESLFMTDDLLELSVDGVLDTNSKLAIRKMKHNMKILADRVRSEGKVSNFMLIRDDDFFPYDWEWRVNSKDTCIEKEQISLSRCVKEQYAMEQDNLIVVLDNGVMMPPSKDKLDAALAKVDKHMTSIKVPTHFRSTKHFTVNTPLGLTGNYNGVSPNRNFTIIDTADAFLASGYGYSIADHDAYLDVTHESLPISSEAIVLINEDKYESIIKDPVIASSLKERKVVVYRGEEDVAINMILSQCGAMPTKAGSNYCGFCYDDELKEIIKNSIKDLAAQNDMLFDQSHDSFSNKGHFSNDYDNLNHDYWVGIGEFVQFLKMRFPEHADLFNEFSVKNDSRSWDIVKAVGTEKLISAINDYNIYAEAKLSEKVENYKRDRASITPEISEYFKKTVKMVQNYHMSDVEASLEPEEKAEIRETIRKFFQDLTVEEQLVAANRLWESLEQVLDTGVQIQK